MKISSFAHGGRFAPSALMGAIGILIAFMGGVFSALQVSDAGDGQSLRVRSVDIVNGDGKVVVQLGTTPDGRGRVALLSKQRGSPIVEILEHGRSYGVVALSSVPNSTEGSEVARRLVTLGAMEEVDQDGFHKGGYIEVNAGDLEPRIMLSISSTGDGRVLVAGPGDIQPVVIKPK